MHPQGVLRQDIIYFKNPAKKRKKKQTYLRSYSEVKYKKG